MSETEQTRLLQGEGETRVGHCKHDPTDVYIGRGPNGRTMHSTTSESLGKRGWLGNPFTVEEYGRAEAVEQFREEFEARLSFDHTFRQRVRQLNGLILGCWCRRLDEDEPLCHGDVIADWADRLNDGGDPP